MSLYVTNSEIEKPDAEAIKKDDLPVKTVPGWVDFMYVVFFFFFASVACSGVLLYFTLEDSTIEELTFGVEQHCGGYPDKWELIDGKVYAEGMDWNLEQQFPDIWAKKHGEDRDGEESEDRTKQIAANYWPVCYAEYARNVVSGNFGSLIEIYLLSLLLFVCLIMEMKEFIAPRGYKFYNFITIIYYGIECVIFFGFFGTFMNVMSVDDGTKIWENPSVKSQEVMNGATNAFISSVLVVRFLTGLIVMAVIYIFKEKNSTHYTEPMLKTCSESCSFFVLIGLSSFLAILVLFAYVEDDTEPGEFVLAQSCGSTTLDSIIAQCSGHDSAHCDPEERARHEAEHNEVVDVSFCERCGHTLTDSSYSFLTSRERNCISETFSGKTETTIISFILAYAASYLFYLILLHGERFRFKSDKGWYIYRISFGLMLFAEACAFMRFYGEWQSVSNKEFTLADPRPMVRHIVGFIMSIALIRCSVLTMLFVLEQYEVGWSYCACCSRYCPSVRSSQADNDIATKTVTIGGVTEMTGEVNSVV